MMRIIVTAVLALIVPAGAAFADEIIIHRDAPAVVDVPPPRDVDIERRRSDCSTTTTRREDELGSSTTTRRDCD